MTIKNTAAALTDMWVPRDIVYGGYLNQVIFGTEKHFPGVLDILNVGIGGSDASQRIDELSEYAIDHPESLENLPVMIIRELADDNLTDSKIQAIRMAWGLARGGIGRRRGVRCRDCLAARRLGRRLGRRLARRLVRRLGAGAG